MTPLGLSLLVASFVYFTISLILECYLIYYEDTVKWIKRRTNLLKALIKDHDQLGKLRDDVESRVRLFWDLEDLSGIHLQLSNAENEWVKSTRRVVDESEACISRYNRQCIGPFWGPLTATLRFSHIIVVVLQIDEFKRKLIDHFKKREEKANNIYTSMENARSKNKGLLLDQYTTEEEDKSIAEPGNSSVAATQNQQQQPFTSLDELMTGNTELFSNMEERWSISLLLPLHAFVKELSQLQLETETEKLWRTEAEEIIKDAEIRIREYLWWFQNFSFFRIFNTDIPIVTNQFRAQMKLMVTDFKILLERKENYNLTFIDRSAEKSIFPSVADDTEVTSAITRIDNRLRDLSQQVDQWNKLNDKLKKTHKQLQRSEETVRRNACMEQLKSIAKEVDNSLVMYMNGHEPKLREITNAIDLLQNIIEMCTIEIQESTKVVGLKNEVRDLVSKLTTGSDNPLKLSIVGIKGIGKTTLAKAVYYNKDVVNHFTIRVWVSVTKGEANKSKVLLMKRDGTKDQTLDVDQVCEHLKERLCLVVLDNVLEVEDFDKLYVTLSGSGWTNGSRIVLTTRFKNVALHTDDNISTHHHIRLLTKDESWELFQKVIQSHKNKMEPKLENFAKEVVGKCGGLPFAILSLGCVMSANGISPKSISWVLKQFNHGYRKKDWLAAWEENKEQLCETIRECLCYFTNFPVNYEIPARRLINLWVAEGLAQQKEDKTPEDVAKSYLEMLRDQNMIQVVALKSNGNIKTCRLPSMLREILQNSNRTNYGQYLGTHLDRRFAYHFDDRGLNANSAEVFSKKGIPVSALFFDKREGSKPGEQVGKILSTGIANEQFLEIKVLDLECIFRPQLPKTVAKFSSLKYLSLRWTYLEDFPLCICNLLELETLDLKHTCINFIPSSIWKLKKLKKLYLSHKYRSKVEGKPSGNCHENLHTLWGMFLYGNYPLLGHLHNLKNLQKLKLAFQLKESERRTLAQEIVKLKQLNSLKLRSVDETGDPKRLILNNMSRLTKLSSLQLFGKLEHRLRMGSLPQNLTDLTLSASDLSDDPMPELQNLLNLKSLCFYANSYTGNRMVCVSGSFQQLQVLRFWNLRNLEEWDVKEGAMPCLIEFEARSCATLRFPTGLKYLKTVQTIKSHKMSRAFEKEVRLYRKKALLVNFKITQ